MFSFSNLFKSFYTHSLLFFKRFILRYTSVFSPQDFPQLNTPIRIIPHLISLD